MYWSIGDLIISIPHLPWDLAEIVVRDACPEAAGVRARVIASIAILW
jgi:hypothetical protein